MALWTPARITTSAWFDAANSATITLSGSDITQVADQSSNNRHLTPATALNPTYASSGINGLGSIVFGSGTDPLITPAFSSPAGADGITVCFVATRTGAPVSYTVSFCKGAVNAEWSLVMASNGTLYWRNTVSQTAEGPTGSIVTGTPLLWSGVMSNAAIKQFINGSELSGSLGADTRNLGGSSALTLGSSPDGAYAINRFQGQFGEFVLLFGDTGDGTRQQLEGYLAHKWGLSAALPTGHPYSLAAPVLFGISGTITDRNGSPCQRKVYAVSRPTDATAPQILANSLSDPTTGAYELVIPSGEEVTRVVVSEDDDQLLNDIVDRVIPE